jgi:lipopolysaccharide transport system ATP-binding protein
VLAVGDASFQKKCLGKMSDVSRQGRTIVFVSHNMTALRKMSTRVIWLDCGKVLKAGEASEVIDHYLQKNIADNREAVWEDEKTAPGDDRVRLRSVRVVLQDGSDGIITVHTPLRIEFTYWNYVPGAVLNVSMILNNLEEVCVLNSGSGNAPRPAGLIRHTVIMPGDFLNAGSYYINVMIIKDASVGILLHNSAVAFEVVEGKVAGNWYGRVPGIVRPKLRWETETIEGGVASIASTAKESG